jgi:hypothetical protein
MKKNLLTVAVATAMLNTPSAWAVVYGDGGASLQSVLDSHTTSPAGNSSVDVLLDQVSPDAYWSISASGGAVSTIVVELAGLANSNKFGVFNGANKVQIFDGPAGPGDLAVLSIMADGSVKLNLADTGIDFSGNFFGFYLQTPSNIFYSDTTLNTDLTDHMAAFRGKGDIFQAHSSLSPGSWSANEYILAWEDLASTNSSYDGDFNDFVVMVESINPVPVPATLALLGLGLMGIGISVHRRPRQ